MGRVDKYRFDVSRTGNMLVPGRVFVDDVLLEQIAKDGSLQQVKNVACLPGIVGRSMAMPDVHCGYGFPIGGVAAFDYANGVISPGGVGYDINCGCRLMAGNLAAGDIRPRLEDLVTSLFQDIPTGVGKSGPIKLKSGELKKVLVQGAAWAVGKGYGDQSDIEYTEDNGVMPEADPDMISDRAINRGLDQLGTLGSGNHFLEIGVVEEIFDEHIAGVYGLFPDQVTVMIHTGSRGLGYQTCDDFLKYMSKNKEDFKLPDRQLACAYLASPAGRRYFAAMSAAANFAWANRQVIMHWARESFMKTLGIGPRDLQMSLVYDVAHNIAKKEKHLVDGEEKLVCVHRKGATRALPAGHPDIPARYKKVGQPVLIPGDMGRASYVLAGARGSMDESFGSCCHGAGRLLSRTAAIKRARGRSIGRELADAGITVKYTGRHTMAEEMPEAYKDVSRVVEVVHKAGLAKKVARIKPMGVIKG